MSVSDVFSTLTLHTCSKPNPFPFFLSWEALDYRNIEAAILDPSRESFSLVSHHQ